MALSDLLAQLNVVDCQGDAGTTGLAGCPFDWDRIETIELSQPSFRYEDAQDLEYIQAQQLAGNLVIIKGLVPSGKNKYENGTFYDYHTGNTYSARAELTGPNTMKLRRYIGVSLMGHTETWTRAK